MAIARSRDFPTRPASRVPRAETRQRVSSGHPPARSSNWDLTLSKMLVGRQGRGVQFRAEFSNAFNQVVWTNVNTAARFDPQGNQVNAQFGQVISTAGPRVIQLARAVLISSGDRAPLLDHGSLVSLATC
jgi:hypothetical protein